jgi:pimeloyl-ACP methyl ester carboxylesterase
MARKPRVYPSVEAAVAAREEQGLSAEAARLIATRNLKPCDGGHVLTTDMRLRGASAVKLTPGQIIAMLDALRNPTLLLIAEQGLSVAHTKRYAAMDEHVPRAQVEVFPGGHHFHMESDVAKLGDRIQAFIEDQK